MAVIGLNPIVDKSVALTVGTGVVTLLELCERLFYIPVSLISTSLGAVFGTRWAEMAMDRDGRRALRRDFWRVQISLGTAGAAVAIGVSGALWLARSHLPDVISGIDARTAAAVLAAYAIGLPAALMNNVGVRAVMALGDTRLLPLFAGAGLTANVVLDIVGARLLGATGIALASSGYRILTCAMVCTAVEARVGRDERWPAAARGVAP
jgi:putative peptidoglycan lipid II flippase